MSIQDKELGHGSENVEQMSWVTLCKEGDLEEDLPRRFEVNGLPVALVYLHSGEYKAISDRCSHEDYSLSDGEVDDSERSLECSKHGSMFSLDTGEPLSLPATRPVPVYEVRVIDGEVQVLLPCPREPQCSP